MRIDLTVDRFWSKVDVKGPDDCWEWKASRWKNGYGRFVLEGKVVPAHRVAYRLIKGEIPANKVAMHSCDNPPCCNPSHISLGTKHDNAIDMMKKGRQNFQKRPESRPSREMISRILRLKARRGRQHHRGVLCTKEKVDKILSLLSSGVSQHRISKEVGLSQSVISHIKNGTHWSLND